LLRRLFALVVLIALVGVGLAVWWRGGAPGGGDVPEALEDVAVAGAVEMALRLNRRLCPGTYLDVVPLVEDGGRIFTIYRTMSEDNLRKQVALPWVSFCSDAESLAPEGVFLKSNPHPRAYGTFARVLGKYVRDEGLMPLQEAIRKLTSLPASVLKIRERGKLEAGYFADIAVFDPAKVQDHSTIENPHQYAVGMQHVFVNGVQVLEDGEHTDAKPGRVVRGPGWTGWR